MIAGVPVVESLAVARFNSSDVRGSPTNLDVSLARSFDARAFGTDLAIGFRTVDSSGADAVRVLRIDTTLVATPK